MNIRLSMRQCKSIVATIFLLVSFGCHSAEADNDTLVYHPSERPMQDVDKLLATARQKQKLALLVLGANWCHDSTGFVSKIRTEPVQSIVTDSYHLDYVDVGLFNDLREVTQRFGLAHYFSTPTVLIIEPNSGRLLNRDTLSIWGSADSVPIEKYVSYFQEYSAISPQQEVAIAKPLQKQISEFEDQQSQRLMDAYIHLRSGLQADIARPAGSDYDKTFVQHWNEVRDFRLQLQKDIQLLYTQARETENMTLAFPRYDRFSWE